MDECARKGYGNHEEIKDYWLFCEHNVNYEKLKKKFKLTDVDVVKLKKDREDCANHGINLEWQKDQNYMDASYDGNYISFFNENGIECEVTIN